MKLGAKTVNEIRTIQLAIKNRRMAPEEDMKDDFVPVFKASLWKLKQDGDMKKPEDWFEREMWVSKNGSLVYWSKREEKDLIYYTHSDLVKAEVNTVDDSLLAETRRNGFEVRLSPQDGFEFIPGYFSATSDI